MIPIDATNEVPAVTTESLPDAGLSLAYSANLAGSGGNGLLKWSKAGGNLPPGLTLTPGGLISGIPQAPGTFNFTVRVADDDTITGSSDEAMEELSIAVLPARRLTNVSIRAFAGAGEDTLIVGFYIAGTGRKTVLIRGIGPKLLAHNVPSVVADPSIALYRKRDPLKTNNNWDAALAPVFVDAGAFPLDVGTKDAAIRAQFQTGAYTVHAAGNGGQGVALIEIYESP